MRSIVDVGLALRRRQSKCCPVSGTAANPVGDGLSNLLKYAFDLDPHATTVAGAPVVSRHAGRVALSYFHRTDASDLFYQLEASPDLLRWSIRNTHAPAVVLPLGVVGQWTVPDTGPFPEQAPHHFLRLRVWQGSGPVELWDGPEALTAIAGRPLIAAELLWVDRSNLEAGYEIQRRLPPDTDWQSLTLAPADTLFHRDTAVAGSATCAYRVRARFPQNLVSPWSAEAAATMLLDTDGDGLADVTETALGFNPLLFSTGGSGLPDGWLWLHLLPLFDPEIGELDSAGDGLTNAQEYAADTDPHATDSDGDDVPDGADRRPVDPLMGTMPSSRRITPLSSTLRVKSSWLGLPTHSSGSREKCGRRTAAFPSNKPPILAVKIHRV